MVHPIYILAIESSCDDTSAAVMRDDVLLSNVTASQAVHEAYGGVVPELASRAHQENIVPVVSEALRQAGIDSRQLNAIAVTRGPGLLGSLLVGVSFAKGMCLSLGIPLIDVNHLQGHVMAHFIKSPHLTSPRGGLNQDNPSLHRNREGALSSPSGETEGGFSPPPYPFLCLLVSGGNSQIVRVSGYNKMEIIGQTIDDAAGEAIDKCAKIMGLPYPGGPHIDRLARQGNPDAFRFAEPHIKDLNYSFSGLKTSFLYSLRDWLKDDPDFIEHHKADLAASLEHTIVNILMNKLRRAVKETGIKHVAVAGGVSANTGLRNAFLEHARRYGWNVYIPPFRYTTDNAAMIGITAYHKYLDGDFCGIEKPAFAKTTISQ